MKYTVTIYYAAAIDYDVEADNENEARDKAIAIEEPWDTFQEKVAASAEFTDAEVVA